MTRVMRVAHRQGARLAFACPGCDWIHEVAVEGAHAWGWNGSLDAPTLTPSVLVRGHQRDRPVVCHSFVTDGTVQYLADCTHALAGQTVPLHPFPDPYDVSEAERG